MPSLPLQIWMLIICVVASSAASPLPFRLSELFGRSNSTTDPETLDERASSPIYVAGAICNAWPANNPTGFKLRVGTLYASCGGHSYKYNDEYKPTGVVSGVDPYYKPECDHVIELQSLLPWIYSTLDTQGFNNMCQALLADSDISNANSMGSRMLAAINTAENLYDIPIAVNQAKKILWNSQTLKTSSLDLGRLALQSYIDAITTQVDSIVTAVTTKLDLAWPQGNGIFVQEADSLTTLFKGKLQTVTTNLATVNAARPPTTTCPARQKLTVVNNVGLPPSTDPADPEAKSVPNPDSVTSDPPPTTTSKRDLMIRNWYLRSASLWNTFVGRSVDRDRQIIRTSQSIHQERAADYSVHEQNNTLALQKRDPASYWVQFCDDNGDNCSISFDIWNPGCFSADGTTVVFHGDPFAALYNLGDVVLVVSPEGGCPCQGSQQDFNVVDLDIDTPYTLTNTGKSYRFVANDDTGDNCPTTSSAVVSSTPSPSSTVASTSSTVVSTDSAVTSSSTLSASSSVVSSSSTQASLSSTPIPSTVSSNSAASSTPSISATAVSTTATGSSSASASSATSTALPSQAPLLQTQPDPGEAADPDEAADAELVCLDESSSSSSSSSTTSSTTTSSSSTSTNSDQSSSPSSTPTDTNGDGGGGGGGGGFSFPAINLPGFSLPGFHLPSLPGPGGISVTDPAGDVGTILTGAGGAIIVIFGGQSTTVGSLPTSVVEPDLSSKTTTNSAGQTITLYSVQPSVTASASSLPATVTPTPAPGSPITITSTGPDGITTLVTTTEGSASAGSPITISTVDSAGVPTVITSIVSAASSSNAVASSTLTTITTTGADGLPTVITSTAGSTPTSISTSSSSIVTITSTGVDGLPTIITSTVGMPTPTPTPASASSSVVTLTTTGADGLPTVVTTAASITPTPTDSSVASTLPSSAVSSVSSTPPPISSSSSVPTPGSIVTTTTTGVDGLPTAFKSTVGVPISSSASSAVTPTPTVGSTVTLTTTGIDGLPTIVTSTVGVATSSTPVLTSISPSSSDVISSSSMSSSSSVVPAPSSTPPPAGSGTYAKFCSDGQQDNCTPGYLISDPTCFTIPAASTGFITFYTQDVPTTDNDNYALVYSPDAACGCQNNVQTVPIAVFNASETTNMQFTGGSYHWLSGVGTANTC